MAAGFDTAAAVGAVLLVVLLLAITGRARSERRQAAMTERELRGIFDTVPVGLVQIGPDGSIRNANPAYCSLSGYTLDELRRMHVNDVTASADRALNEHIGRLMSEGQGSVFRCSKHCVTKDGRTVPIGLTLRTVRDARERPLYIVGAVQDLSESVRLREAQRVCEQAEAAHRAKSELVARVSHELRTPLNAILGFAQLLDTGAAGDAEPSRGKWLASIQQAGWHLLAMINDLLDLSQLESGRAKLDSQPLALPELVEACVAMVEQAATLRGITIRRCVEGGQAVTGDPVRVRQVLINLLSNAVKYNRDGGTIEVRTRSMGGALAIEVSDTGSGMTQAQLGALFQPFNRLGREHSGIEGHGIGLVIAKRLAEQMGGSLHARSVAGRGSTFTLVLPAARDDAGQPLCSSPGMKQLFLEGASIHAGDVPYSSDPIGRSRRRRQDAGPYRRRQ